MGRQMPGQCIHGYIYDWGDLGPTNHSMPEKCHHGCNDDVLATWQRGYDRGRDDEYLDATAALDDLI